MPDFSSLPTPGPIRFGDFTGAAVHHAGGQQPAHPFIADVHPFRMGQQVSGSCTRRRRSASNPTDGLPAKIVFGDVEVVTSATSHRKTGTTTESGSHNNHPNHHHNNNSNKRREREARVKAVAAVLRNKRIGRKESIVATDDVASRAL